MGNWRELGVVPDSDDEAWGSEDSQPPLLPISTPHLSPRAEPKPQPDPPEHDTELTIWDLPQSSGPPQNASVDLRDEPKTTATPHSSGLETAGRQASQWLGSTAPELDGDNPGGSSGSDRDSPDPLAGVPQELVSVARSPSSIRRHGLSPSLVHITVTSADPFPGDSLHQDADESSFDGLVRDHDQGGKSHVGLPNETQGPDPPPATRSESPPRPRRSFRPRKPIQEHPYLLENAQYSKLVKSHGVKPIRITIQEHDAIRRRNEVHPQDHEYSEDESQEASDRPDPEPCGRRHHKEMERTPLDDAVDELALPQSPRTSSPQRHLRASSEQGPDQHTDATSINDDDEFPDIRDFAGTHTREQKRIYTKSLKRQLTPVPSTPRKRPKTRDTISVQQPPSQDETDAWDLPLSPGPYDLTSRIRTPFSPDVSPRQRFLPTSIPSSATPPEQPRRLLPLADTVGPIDSTRLSAGSEQKVEHAPRHDSPSSESDSELVRRTGRRIRGVLPASWLRLDQQGRKKKVTKTVRRPSSPPSPDQPRPGLAMRKSGTSKLNVSTRSFLEEMDEDTDEDNARRNRGHPGTDSGREADPASHDFVIIDDANSVVEEDMVDWMLPGQTRNRTSSAGPPKKRRKTDQKVFQGKARPRYRQQKISSSVNLVDRPSKSASGAEHHKTTSGAVSRSQRAVSPPALSIVDFVEPDAPNFIKIAVRVASGRRNMGRSKPANKNINLGNRADNVDALSVLKSWKTGTIKTSRSLRAPTRQKSQVPRPSLQPLSANVNRQPRLSGGLSFAQPQKLTRQTSIGFGSTQEPTSRFAAQHAEATAASVEIRPHARGSDFDFRPAQLEADVPEDLTARKKMLDLVFRQNRTELLAPTFQLRRSTPDPEPTHPRVPETPVLRAGSEAVMGEDERPIASTRRRRAAQPRKSVLPKRIDLDAPQFRHANDPLPLFDTSVVGQDVATPRQERSKISGLGSFGTHYTQHFDIFPLHRDTFFHQTTIIGKGTLKKALEYRVSETITCVRTEVSFQFSDQRFSWGRWNDKTSSDLGQVFDQLTDQLEGSWGPETCSEPQRIIALTDHILGYILDSVSVDEEAHLRPFVQRCSGLLVGFMDQTVPSTLAQFSNRTLLQVNSRFLIFASVLLRFCQGTVELSDEAQQVEELLKRLANVVIAQLLKTGLVEIRTTYDDLQRLAFRERGIRSDAVALTSWVIVLKVLGSAQIPRAGFWDLVCSAMAGDVHRSTDAQTFDGVWRDMFSLLPLGEFDDAGILSKGMRYEVPLQGWALPQKLLKVVFESYQSNQRQSPSFNEYCRALLARCHHLIEQWGWHKCVGIIGTIFDFFGHQNLSHLRNEEVYKSPRFLEELSDRPCLSVAPEDRCFHIFLKILAVAIQNMRRHGLSNDVRNLIARCLPNHDRQYAREQTIHTRDLASLRNHHDLLCTLFWAAPPEDRRPVDMIENLVQPASSHKEACLINLRAWSQLARFIVSSGGSAQEFRSFLSWQNNVFQQVLNQYLSAAADVQQQFMSLAKEARGGIQQQLLDNIVAANQTAAKDILYRSVVASLDVMRCCPSLTSSMLSMNITQMSKIFNKLITMEDDLDWSILRACFETIDLLMKRFDDLWSKSRESTNDSVSTHSNHELEDAVDFIDDKIVQVLFVAVRRLMGTPACNENPLPGSASVIVENAIILCGRIASVFIDGGKRQVQHFFTAGKYGLFEALPEELGLKERRFLPLFVATLLKNHIFNFSGLGCNHFDIWLSSLVKPYHALRYENYLAETLKQLGMGFVEGIVVSSGAAPDYNKNRDFFASSISYMRRELRKAQGVQKKALRARYKKLLEMVMAQMKTDIKSLELNSTEHRNYVSFVRAIVGLIRSHSVPDICQRIDPFYLRVSAQYSPAKEDPQLHTAGILSYGVRLGEGDMTAASELFWYLYSHFKESLSNGQLDAESKIIENGIMDDNTLAFVIGSMLPAVIQASSHSPDIWPLLSVYSKALQDVLGRSYLPREIPEACVEDVVALLVASLSWLRNLVESSSEITGLTPTQAHIFTELMAICNALRPSLMCWLIQPLVGHTKSIQNCIVYITRVSKQAAAFLDKRASQGSSRAIHDIPVKSLLGAAEIKWLPPVQTASDGFAQNLIREVQNKSSWVVTSDRITTIVMTTSSAQLGTQSGQGVKNDLDKRSGLLSALLNGLKTWVDEIGELEEKGGPSRRQKRWP